MSNAMPFMLSSSPPPIDDNEEDEDDEFGDFRVAEHTFALTDCISNSDSPDHINTWGGVLGDETKKKCETPEVPLPAIPQDISEPVFVESSSSDYPGKKLQLEEINGLSVIKVVPDERTDNGKTGVMKSYAVVDNSSVCAHQEALEEHMDEVPVKHVIDQSANHINESIDKNIELCSMASSKNVSNSLENSAISMVVENGENRTSMFNRDQSIKNTKNLSNSDVNEDECFGDFGDFTDFTAVNDQSVVQNSQSSKVIIQNVLQQSQTPSFTMESISQVETQLQPLRLTNNDHVIDDDDDDDDEFGDFNDFEEVKIGSLPSVKEPPVDEILKSMFQISQCNPEESYEEVGVTGLTDTLHLCLDDSSSVWGHLKELETSHALSYQWSNSTANKTLLASLNIHCRNILFGAKWNLNVPRFAANLGVSPLEPLKANETVPSMNLNPGGPSSPDDVVPAAQFDWTTSGLTNPLDGLEKESGGDGEIGEGVVEATEEATESVKPFVEDVFGSGDIRVDDSSGTLTPSPPVPNGKRTDVKAEAYAVVDSFPDLSFLSARKLMHAANENMSRWKLGP